MATEVILLGTGTPRTELGRAGSATAVTVDGRPYIFDFGPGVGRRISRAFELDLAPLRMSRITRAFLTHMHSDHTLGLPELMLMPWMFGRAEPLEVYGPLGMKNMVMALQDAYALDIAKRRSTEPHPALGYMATGIDVVPGRVYQDDLLTVDAFDVPHGDWDERVHGRHPTMGYKVVTSDATIAISGDTGPFAAMAELYSDCDVVVHEVFSSVGLSQRPARWQDYHRRSHTSASDLGSAAAAARPGLLVLTHQLLWGACNDDLMDEMVAAYDGPLHNGADLDVVFSS